VCFGEDEDTLDVVSISQATEFFLSGGIPGVETDWTKVGVEFDRVNFFHTRSAQNTQKHGERERGVPSTPRVAMYFFSNSPVRCLLTKVVYIHDSQYHCFSYKNKVGMKGKEIGQYLSSASIANEDKLESRHIGVVFHVVQLFVDVLGFY
jgi:hypothetical protein